MMAVDLVKVRQSSEEKITSLLQERQQELAKVRLDLTLGKVKNYRKIRQLRKEIAVLKTVLREKRLLNLIRKS